MKWLKMLELFHLMAHLWLESFKTLGMEILQSSWFTTFAIETPIFELIARGCILYLCILFLMRFMPCRTGGELAVMDWVFVLLIAEAASHAMGDYTSITDGLILIVTFMILNFSVNFLSYKVPFIEKLIS
jgi:hypothetical protein